MNLYVSPSPHVRSEVKTNSIMRDVLIALAPACIWGILSFGWRAAMLMAVSVGVAVLTEFLLYKLMKRRSTIGDLSAAVTGLLLALNVPASAPWWVVVVGAAFAIGIAKVPFGGLGHNFVNPALSARAFLVACWPVRMTSWVANGMTGFGSDAVSSASDAIASATPLPQLAAGVDPAMGDLFFGFIKGCIGEISVAALLLGAIYLFIRKIIKPHIPLAYILTVFAISLFAGGSLDFAYALRQIMSGGLMLGAFFMATDYTTSPETNSGKIIFGIGCGLITVLIRQLGGYPEGVTFAILLMNLVTPLIERVTRPRAFGEPRKARKKEVPNA